MYNNNSFWAFKRKLLENSKENEENCPFCGRETYGYCEKCDYPTKDRPSKPMSANQKRRAAAEAKKAAKNN